MIAENIFKVRNRIAEAATRAGRDPGTIKLVAVSKTVGAHFIAQAIEAGQRLFGENRVQEAMEKISYFKKEMPAEPVEWHFIGHLQRNKARFVVGAFDLIHSLDSVALADELQKQAEKKGVFQKVLIEVKLSPESSKQGIDEKELAFLLEHTAKLGSLEILGLMTMPPFFDDPECARPYFRRLRELRDNMQSEGFHLPELSMGMSGDFEIAIEEGATIVRVGTAIFGERI